MKKSPLGAVLVVLLSLSVLATAVLSCWYVQSVRQMRRLQGLVASVNVSRNVVRALIGDAKEYAKKNPRMEALLNSMNQQPQPAVSTNAPSPVRK